MIQDLTINQKKDKKLFDKVEDDLKEWAIEIEAEKIIIESNPHDDYFEANIKILIERQTKRRQRLHINNGQLLRPRKRDEVKVEYKSEQDRILSVTYKVKCERKVSVKVETES